MCKVLITGANGFLGYYLVKDLLHKNSSLRNQETIQIIATGKGECRLSIKDQSFHYESLDFTNEESVSLLFKEFKPQVVIHCGAISKPDECELNKENAFRVNVTGTINLLNTSDKYKSFFVFLSTDFVFDGEKGFYKEDDTPAPVNYYGQTKLLAEEEVMKYNYERSIVRTVLVYGKTYSGRDNLATNVAKVLQENRPLKIFDDQVRTPTYVEDLAAGIDSVIQKKATGIYHIAGEDVLTPYQMAVAVAEFLQLDKTLITPVKAGEFKELAKRPLKTGLDISKAKKNLHYQPVSFEEGLRRTFEE